MSVEVSVLCVMNFSLCICIGIIISIHERLLFGLLAIHIGRCASLELCTVIVFLGHVECPKKDLT